MKINYKYEKREFEPIIGYIFKGRYYRCRYIRYKTFFSSPERGTEDVQIYNFEPRENTYASALIIHGLGSANVKFLLWLGNHLASVGVNASVLILPGNYTRVENNSVSGKSYLYPDLKVMYKFWENAVIDVMTTLDFLEQDKVWHENNILIGYCLGGMVSTIVSALDTNQRISELLLMTTGGNLPNIMYESPKTKFIRTLFEKGYTSDYFYKDKKDLYKIYDEQFKAVKKMNLDEILESETIHPLFKIDPISYAHLINKEKVTIFEAIFDRTLSRKSRKDLAKELKGSKHYAFPLGHVSWLPFEYLLGQYIMNKLNIKSIKLRARLLEKDRYEENFGK
jgi:hypothetical protein